MDATPLSRGRCATRQVPKTGVIFVMDEASKAEVFGAGSRFQSG